MILICNRSLVPTEILVSFKEYPTHFHRIITNLPPTGGKLILSFFPLDFPKYVSTGYIFIHKCKVWIHDWLNHMGGMSVIKTRTKMDEDDAKDGRTQTKSIGNR